MSTFWLGMVYVTGAGAVMWGLFFYLEWKARRSFRNTLCPKIGAQQWTCSKAECQCHLKAGLPDR